ncbi:hypothetical protein N9549_05775 [Acidimicrobiales bacterium]|nr:hypothetical protein [Acidimicrobiaceae bacterium]MDB4103561.1 hypothetical protein [Acidimicrobiales bacterium]HAY68675.1 hypothetical protein [Acidimicrobiaceae bacterium]
MDRELTQDELRDAAGGDLSVLAVLMLVGSVSFAALNMWVGTMGWIAAALAVSSTLLWTTGLLRRSATIAAFVKIGFGFSGLAAPAVAIVGVLLALVGDYRWGWAVVAGAVVYFFFSLLGLEIIERAQETGAIERFEL